MADPTITDKAETAAVIEKRFPGGRCLCSSQDPCPCSGQLVRYCPCYRDEAARLVATTNEVVEPTTPGPIPGVDPTTKAKLDAIEVDLRGGYVRSGEHIAEDPDEFRHEQFVNVADLPSIIHAWASAALPVLNTARPRLIVSDVPITERTPHGVWIADGPDPDSASPLPTCGGLSGCGDCRAYNDLRQHLVEQIIALDEQHQREMAALCSSRDSETAGLAAKVAELQGIARRLVDERDEMQRTITRQMGKIGDLVSEIEKLRTGQREAVAAELNTFASSFAEGRDALTASGCPSEAAILGGCAKALRARAASLRGEQ